MPNEQFSILLIDDDPDTQNMFRMVSNHHQLDLAMTNDAETAIEYLREHQPDIIVLDILLPGMDGYQALKRIRQGTLAPDVSIIATTAYYNADTRTEILARGFNGYLPKPFNPVSLVEYLKKIASERPKAS